MIPNEDINTNESNCLSSTASKAASDQLNISPSIPPKPQPSVPHSWDPFTNLSNRQPSKDCLTRIRRDYTSLQKDPLPGIYCVPDETYTTLVHALIIGPFDTPYEGGYFYFIINFPDDYPHQPPKAKLMTTGGGTVRFNPNLYANGKVCLSILGTWSGPSWSPVQSLSSVLLSIQSLMNEKPYHNEPGFEASNSAACASYTDIIRHETIRVAVCEMVHIHTGHSSSSSSSSHNNSSSGSGSGSGSSIGNQLPDELQNVIQALFGSFVDSYKLTCESNLSKDGQSMVDPFGDSRGRFMYGYLMSRLTGICAALDITDTGDSEAATAEAEGEEEEGRGVV